jgi:2-(1,2-epoxy-1,2-dihydrophenyl)acetyl-CoA isomerase
MTAAGTPAPFPASGLLVHDHGAVRVLTLNRPHRRNALDVETAETLTAEIERAGREHEVRALVLTGAGQHFSAGGDADAIVAAMDDPDDQATLRLMRTFHRLVESIWTCELPVVAAVRGAVYGGAFNLVLCCDLVVAAPDSRFCEVFLRRQVVPDLGGGYLLPRIVGIQRAKQLMFMTDEIDAETARSMGIVTTIPDEAEQVLEVAVATATSLAERSRIAVALTKRLVNESTTGSLQSSLGLEAALQAHALGSAAAREGFATFRSRPGREGSP